jgi:hypothetical protein
MEFVFLTDLAQRAWEWFSATHFFAALRIFLGIYTAVLLIDIVLLLSMRNLGEDLRKDLFGAADVPVSRSRLKKQWKAVRDRLKSDNPSEYKVALLEADALVDKVLGNIGYKGENMAERLAQVTPEQMEDVEALREAHQLRNRVVFEQDFALGREQAEKALGVYEAFLTKMEVF